MATLRERLSSLEAIHAKRVVRGSMDVELSQVLDHLQQVIWDCWDAGEAVAGPPTAEEDARGTAELLATLKKWRNEYPSTAENTP